MQQDQVHLRPRMRRPLGSKAVITGKMDDRVPPPTPGSEIHYLAAALLSI